MTEPKLATTHVVGEPTFEGLARFIERNNITKIFVMVGAGISVAAGIPDFRSPHTGLYAKLSRYNLNSPEDAFSLPLLRQQPSVFYNILMDMDLWPGKYCPTTVHHFISLLAKKGMLLCCCTQNIDGLERACGIPESLLVEAHGSFSSASCVDCHAKYDINMARAETRAGKVPHCNQCGGIVKPDVVFFGENLPEAFFNVAGLIEETELLLILGTSLQVHPFADLALMVPSDVPRVLFNLERVGGRMFRFPTDRTPNFRASSYRLSTGNGNGSKISSGDSSNSSSVDGYDQFTLAENDETGVLRDIFFPGDCQVSVRSFAQALGFGEQLDASVREGREIFERTRRREKVVEG
ncbi:Silent information regulator 2 related protein 1 [Trypanosoma equiperdum]|uniref:NAD-dependent protein deacetylase SIR2rp1 n=2 Tax=Trypanozoon TaxID=39700 RepID=SIR2_TRYB2|nr:silent information regulator 2 [Trypanosoma brucei brucei TREU927]Q57V41.1 RecName: Full=NAD-dependent protein deacetylase SIR2rp1; AltName: Full=Regulatory protein SIR2 homolog 1; AltName: Full=SIR2-related protein 1 [Trypanosoma brucei brucei TREU927]AAX70528.1 silent information regulator 2 [Trypanosoma brucei]AAZ12234.1 silent information regulator 2 [Trypanosoma brucei brucei TREU927]SCU71967.1 Silent information regulator 2 related protein 1 [Trypanosoma equiperdum]